LRVAGLRGVGAQLGRHLEARRVDRRIDAHVGELVSLTSLPLSSVLRLVAIFTPPNSRQSDSSRS
jgi:hypothetical protein